MAENFDINFLKPHKGKHAITEVIFSVYLASPIINSQRYKALVEEGGKLAGKFQNFKPATGINFNMKITKGTLETPVQTNVNTEGFQIQKFKDGNMHWVISYQPSLTPGQDLLQIHCLEYPGWNNFFNEVVVLLKNISDFEDLYIRGYSLYFLDQLNWIKNELPDMSKIFKKGLYLSDLFLETKGVWNFQSNTHRPIGDKLISENTNIGVNQISDNNYLVFLFHHASTMFNEYKSLGHLLEDAGLKQLADEMHTLNKTFLGQTLTDEIQKLIGLKEN